MADKYFCLDIGEKFTKVADAKLSGDKLEVASLGKIETEESFFTSDLEKSLEDQSNSIKKLVDSLKIVKKNVSVVIPSSYTYSQILTMPLLNEKELISAIKYQADQFIPMPIEETNIDLEIIEEYKEEKKLLILIVAAAKKLIEKVQNMTETAGLIPETIENELSASSRLVNVFGNKFIPAGQDNIIMANFGVNSTAISQVSRPNFIVKESHTINIGYQLFLKEIKVNTDSDIKKASEILLTFDKKNLSSSPVEVIAAPLLNELGNEIKRFGTNKKISAIYFFNQIFLFPSLCDFISKQLGIPVIQLNPSTFSNQTPMIQSYKNELPLFISSFGGNLR